MPHKTKESCIGQMDAMRSRVELLQQPGELFLTADLGPGQCRFERTHEMLICNHISWIGIIVANCDKHVLLQVLNVVELRWIDVQIMMLLATLCAVVEDAELKPFIVSIYEGCGICVNNTSRYNRIKLICASSMDLVGWTWWQLLCHLMGLARHNYLMEWT